MLTAHFFKTQPARPGWGDGTLENLISRCFAQSFGSKNVRVNAISAGPMRTLAGSAIGGAREILRYSQDAAPLSRELQLQDIGGAALYLLSDLSASVTGEIHHVDSGFSTIGMPHSRD